MKKRVNIITPRLVARSTVSANKEGFGRLATLIGLLTSVASALVAAWSLSIAIKALQLQSDANAAQLATLNDQRLANTLERTAAANAILFGPLEKQVDRSDALQAVLDRGRGLSGAHVSCPTGQEVLFPDLLDAGDCLVQAQIIGVTFDATKISTAEGRMIQSSVFRDAYFGGGGFPGTMWVNVDFSKSHFESVNFEGTAFYFSRFNDSRLAHGRLNGAIFSNVTFENADLSQARFDGARFNRVNISGAKLCQNYSTSPVGSELYHSCAKGLTKELMENTYYVEGRPPIGLELLSADLQPTHVCPVDALEDLLLGTMDNPCLPGHRDYDLIDPPSGSTTQ